MSAQESPMLAEASEACGLDAAVQFMNSVAELRLAADRLVERARQWLLTGHEMAEVCDPLEDAIAACARAIESYPRGVHRY